MEKQILIFVITLVAYANGYYKSKNNYNSYYENCQKYENKVYQLKVTFPDKEPLYAAIELLPKGAFVEIFSIANGNNAAEIGNNISLSNRYGTYKCYPNYYMRLTGIGFLYKTPGIPFLQENGALVVHDYYFRFSSDYKTCDGLVKFVVHKNGQNPFTTTEKPVFESEIANVKCELLKYRSLSQLTGV